MNEGLPASTKYPLETIYFYLTEDCNLRCRHCWIQPDFHAGEVSKEYLPLDVFKSIIDQAIPLGLSSVKLTGGEPLYHPDIIAIIEYIREKNLFLNVESNGVLFTPEIARAVASHKRSFVSVSLDGVDASTHEWVRGVDGCFEDAINGVRNLVNVGIKPQMIMSIMKRNVGQVDAFVDLAASLGASSVKFNVITPTARGLAMHDARETLPIEELVELGDYVENTLSKSAKIPIHFSHPMAFKSMSRMFGKTSCGLSGCGILKIMGVLANGSYAMCGIGETVPELIYGNATVDALRDVWSDSPVLKELREGIPSRFEGICRDCLLRKVCIGSCMAQNYYRQKNLWAPFWYCEEAQKKGLFPASRMYSKDI